MAYLLALEGKRTPGELLTRIKSMAPDGILKGIPSGTEYDATLASPPDIFHLLLFLRTC